jgi:hypothetical protein
MESQGELPMSPTPCKSLLLSAWLLAAAASVFSPPASAGKAHVHGQARLDIAVEGPVLSVHLESPLDSLLGFEHRPRTAAQRQAADAALARLRDAASWLRPPAAAQCQVTETVVEAAVLEAHAAGAAPAGAAEPAHADVDVHVAFRCAAPEQLTAIEVGLFEAFARMKRIDVQVASARGQSKQTLRPPATRVTLAR